MNKKTRIFLYGFVLLIVGCVALAILLNNIADNWRDLNWLDWVSIPVSMIVATSGLNKIEKSIK